MVICNVVTMLAAVFWCKLFWLESSFGTLNFYLPSTLVDNEMSTKNYMQRVCVKLPEQEKKFKCKTSQEMAFDARGMPTL